MPPAFGASVSPVVPSPVRSWAPLRAVRGQPTEPAKRSKAPVAADTLSALRRARALVSHDRAASVLAVLLPTRDAASRESGSLERLGFAPEGSSRYLVRAVGERDLESVCAAVLEALGPSALWDLGPVFTHAGSPSPIEAGELPRCWSGAFVLRVRGTPRALVLEHGADVGEVRERYDEQWDAYLATELCLTE